MGYAQIRVNKTLIARMVSSVDQSVHARPTSAVSTTLIVLVLMVPSAWTSIARLAAAITRIVPARRCALSVLGYASMDVLTTSIVRAVCVVQ